MLDLYCERVAPGLLAEPLNTATNLAFFLAAWAAWALARRVGALDIGSLLLIALAVTIGLGSSLFHMFATDWARLLDIVPVLAFQLLFLWLYTRRVMGTTVVMSWASVTVLLVAALSGRRYPDMLNGSLIYLPALAVLLGLGVFHYARRQVEPFLLIAAAGVLAVSVLCRTIDDAVCRTLPVGTHFLWHTLNGVVLYLSIRAIVVNRRVASPQTGRHRAGVLH